VLDASGLQIAVFEYLREALPAHTPGLAAVQAYLAAARDDARQRAVRLFQLSARVAWLMREYSTARRTMLDKWPHGSTLGDHRMRESEVWQRQIYVSLFDRDGSLRPNWIARATDPIHEPARWMMLPYAFDAIDDRRLRQVLPPRLHVFGIGYAGPEFIRIFARLGALTELHIYTLNPCREFWEDVRDRHAIRPPRVGPLFIDSAEDPFGLEAADENLALRYWGRAGREYIRLLNETTACDFDEHFVEPISVAGNTTTLLSHVQQAILTRSPEQRTAVGGDNEARSRVGHAPPDGEGIAQDDGSIRILECPGVRREIEIAANAIWSIITRETNRDAKRLRFHQIAVVIPEAVRDRYLTHIESVFAGAHRIPVNLVDRRLAAQSRVAEAVDLLLRLPLGRFTRDEMIRLLTHPAIAGRDDEPHLQVWPEWCRRLGVHFGADERAVADTYIEPKLYHWDYALKRLALGLFMTGEPSGDTRVFNDGGGHEYLPFEVPEDAAESVAIMVRKARSLIREAQSLAECQLGLADWRRVLIELIATYVNPADRADERVRDLIVGALDSMHTDGLRSEAVPYEVAQELALARIAEVEAEQGTYAESGVVVGSLTALRSIPFRVVFMLGLGEADFPAREAHDPLDLRQAHRRAGDVSPAERDRYMFLETLAAARDRIYLSYVARDANTGEALEPSAVIRDLQYILCGMIGDEATQRLALAHPVSAHDHRYFADLNPSAEPRNYQREAGDDPRDHPDDRLDNRADHQDSPQNSRLESFDRNARRSAQIAAMRADLERRCGPIPETARDQSVLEQLSEAARDQLEPRLRIIEAPVVIVGSEDSRVRLTISALRHYLECPLQGAARYALGMRDEDDDDEGDAGEEPIARSFLDAAMTLRDTFWLTHGIREDICDRYDEASRLRVLSGSAPVGPFAAQNRLSDLTRLERAIAQIAGPGIPQLDRWLRIAVGGVEEFTDIDRAIDPLILEVDFTRADGRRVTSIELRGRVGPVSPLIDRSLKLIGRDEIKVADFLEGGLNAIVLAAAGETRSPEFIAMVIGGENKKAVNNTRIIQLPTRTEARAYLAQLASDLLGGDNDVFLPIEAVAAVLLDGVEADAIIERNIQSVRNKDRPSCRSDYGPVRKDRAREFRAPLSEIRHGLIARRYGPLRAIFDQPETT
jgi:exodeoxyribonuclease V gamma subunit